MPAMSPPSGISNARVFFALWPTNAEQCQLSAWQKPLLNLHGGRAMRAGTLHNTLVFIGDIGQDRLGLLRLAALEVRGNSFELWFDKAHYWGHNHIVYAAPAGTPQLLALLVGELEQRLKAHRFGFDRRDYQPHVTLLRNARRTDTPTPAMQPVCWQVRDFALVQSVPQGGQREYRVLERFPLEVG